MARRGLLVDVGRGTTRTNPIDERDVARAVADAAASNEPVELAVGGPQTMTRGELYARLAAAVQRRVRVLRVPVVLGRLGAAALALLHPRLGQFARFGAALARHDAVAPAFGTRTLDAYLGQPG
jgi:uncharacterized protein YbjT (DUF2867 family)